MITPIEDRARSAAPLEATSESSHAARRPVLPPYHVLAAAAALVNGVAIAAAIVAMKPTIAAGIAAGLAIGLLVYAALHRFVSDVGPALAASVGGRAGADPKPMLPKFALLTAAKFVVIACVMGAYVRWAHAGLPALMAGFLLTQITITLVCVRSLNSTPLIG